MLNVWCVCVGDKYGEEDIAILKYMVDLHVTQAHDFYVLSDRQIGNYNCLVAPENWPGWWSKLLLFRYAGGQILYLDLDVVVVGDLDRLVSKQLSMAANWAQSGHGGCQSSVMSWDSDHDNLGYIPDLFDPDQLKPASGGNYGWWGKCWGDQEFITEVCGEPGGEYVTPMSHIYSYKYHCLSKVPDDASVVCFHGDPKPSQVNAKWVKAARSST